jgi:hypothetical protein
MRCTLPPLAEQERLPCGYDIAAIVARYPLTYPFGHRGAGERLPIPHPFTGRAQQREAEKQVEMLFQSLLSEAFKN